MYCYSKELFAANYGSLGVQLTRLGVQLENENSNYSRHVLNVVVVVLITCLLSLCDFFMGRSRIGMAAKRHDDGDRKNLYVYLAGALCIVFLFLVYYPAGTSDDLAPSRGGRQIFGIMVDAGSTV